MLKNTIAIAYDFDGTLAPGNMQENAFIPDLNMSIPDFWDEANKIARENDMDEVLAYMFLMLQKAKEKSIPVKKKAFLEYGSRIQFYKGVETFFDRINQYASSKGFQVEHYIISSGNREFVEGSRIAHYFTDIFASGFMYDQNGIASWPALAVNYTNKTQFLFRINKGIHNSYDNTLINKIVPENDKPIPFSNMIYLGDGETDVPAMKMVKLQGGIAVAVYNPEFVPTPSKKRSPKDLCTEIVMNKRADFMAPADYSENTELDILIKKCIDKIVSDQLLFGNID
ncbi:MAG TPA: HAD family hydrolase [Bacteroidales bacterium]|jgi:phosphoserine phosphatase|nr:HAD family hydrolase [Bacteroidales bacterium]HPS71366.1 HAD family hydrolase [Bacteroidales bacterium]